jgi:Holliday junction resolvase-like predicted endonuclease
LKEEILDEERELVRKLRYEDKLKYKEIAEKLNRSLYWVHCRLSDKYQPAAARVEKRFQDAEVEAYFEKQGHKIIRNGTRTKCDEFSQEVDILSTKDGFIFVTEVKNIVNHHQIQTAIGQIILHKFAYRKIDTDKIIYQIVFPDKFREYRYFSQDFMDHLDKEFGIKIIFV